MVGGVQEKEREAATAKDRRWRAVPVWGVAALVLALMIAGYWLFVRTTYVPLLSDVAPQDAAAIVKVLDARKIDYRLEDQGRTILVANDKADGARIELVGSELPMRGQVGFELFNQSDMGLTEFAQKINYQRALQGELARTILLMDGIAAVRVHLGLPERGVFRDLQAQPKASVTLILKSGATLTERTVAGVQQLVAGAVPEMTTGSVAVLDGTGRVISRGDASPATVQASTASDATIASYRARIAAVIDRRQPSLRYDLVVSLRQVPSDADALDAQDVRDPAVEVRVTTAAALDGAEREALADAIRAAIDFDAARGDRIDFLVGPLPTWDAATPARAVPDRVVARTGEPAVPVTASGWRPYWPLAGGGAAIVLLVAWWRDRRRTRQQRRGELTSFSDTLRERLARAEGAAHGG